MNATGIDVSTAPPYTVIWWNQFQENPQSLYNLCSGGQEGTINVSDDVVNLTQVNSRTTFGVGLDHSWEIKVKSSEDMERLRSDLMSKPILFRATLDHVRTDFYVVFAVHKNWNAELAVLVNTKHPSIREVLSTKLNEVTQAMREGEKFCLKLDFGEPVVQWYCQQVDTQRCWSRTVDCRSMALFINNCSMPIDICFNPVIIVYCFPCWLFGGPCYCIHRKGKRIDRSYSFRDLLVVSQTENIKAYSKLRESFTVLNIISI
ncbi:uncharacterized protein LOC133173365 [Saccostrea echinata]|uniref:uncharacterized protein LOC133173365 n=1 Tax=Saccostrea echinata TaxID=191078 RepID=UPI002A8035C7|nr:uncharacterized protein LOC133173365 [Saccostrea echinata]